MTEQTLYGEFAEELKSYGVPEDMIRRMIVRVYEKAYNGFLSDAVMRL
jgi:hypothetical protein